MRQYDAISDDAHQMNHVNWICGSDELNLATCMHDVTNVVCEEDHQHITELFTVLLLRYMDDHLPKCSYGPRIPAPYIYKPDRLGTRGAEGS